MTEGPIDEEVLWSGIVEFNRTELKGATLNPGVTVKKSGRTRMTPYDLAGGRLLIKGDGVHWKAGSWLTPLARTSGEFFLPWSEVEYFTVGKIPFKVNALGGNVTIKLRDGGTTLTGEFPGSRSALQAAIEAASGMSSPSDPDRV